MHQYLSSIHTYLWNYFEKISCYSSLGKGNLNCHTIGLLHSTAPCDTLTNCISVCQNYELISKFLICWNSSNFQVKNERFNVYIMCIYTYFIHNVCRACVWPIAGISYISIICIRAHSQRVSTYAQRMISKIPAKTRLQNDC